MFSETRQKVIENSVLLEAVVTNSLAALLDIDILESKSLGHRSGSLSFANKILILTDLKIIDKDDKVKFEYFTAIRNQFAHNIHSINFTSCFKNIGDMENKLKKLYNDSSKISSEVENRLEEYYTKLFDDIYHIVYKLFSVLIEKGRKRGKQEITESLHEYKKQVINKNVTS